MAWILEPISIATEGYVGIGPLGTGFCPAPLAIGSQGYIRFEVGDRRDGDGGAGIRGVIIEPQPAVEKGVDPRKVIAAIIAIQEYYE